MTLPFRRRHHDDESSHDRARALTSSEMLEALGAADADWLARHLESCAECRRDREAYLDDRALLRGLRERTPEPPRDLWARTSAALEREARGRRGRPGAAGAKSRPRGIPFGAAAGAAIVLVVVGASLIPSIVPPAGPDRSQAAQVTTLPEATTFEVTAGRVGWIRQAANGSWELVTANVGAVCPRSRPACRPLAEDDPGRPINLGVVPAGVTISPNEDQLVVEARAQGSAPDRIYVVPVPPAVPVETAVPTESATTVPVTAAPTTTEPPVTEPPSPGPSPINPAGAIEIASGVMVVGEAAYSSDGKWLAFSARPSDGSAGPDLYLWSVGQPVAVAVTSDHRTYFSAWLDGLVLASRVEEAVPPEALETPGTSEAPVEATADADATVTPDRVEAHPSSFLLDPQSLARTEIARPDVWLPVVDPTSRLVAFWSGTLLLTADGLDWELGTGQFVLGAWSTGQGAAPTADPAAASGEPEATPVPIGPAGSSTTLVTDETAAFKAKFDPSGTRLAVWVGEELDAQVGRLHLVVLDPEKATVDGGPEPLPGAPALRRFSIGEGRLAWVSPSGQDGQQSTVQVLGWTSTQFGEIRSIPAKDLYIVR
jgi:hypothetical protein